jgi:hypothetical protein
MFKNEDGVPQNSKFKNKVAFKTTSNKLAVPLQLLKEAYKK